jgi:galactofuranose transport system substrate-binding protein
MSARAKIMFVVSIAIALWVASSCSRQGGAEGPKRGTATVAYSSVGDPNAWFTTFAGEMEKEAKKRGYAFTVVHAQAKVEKQIADVEDLVAKKPDVLILGPIDVKGSAPCLGVAKKAGVPVIVVNRDIEGEPGKDYVTRVYSDFEWVGAKEAETIAKALGADKPIKIVELHGTSGGGNTIGLAKGFREEMKRHKNMEIVVSRPGNYDRVTALESMKNVVQTMGGSFNAVFAHSDVEGVAAIQSLKEKGYRVGDGRDNSVVVVSNGGLKDAILAVKAGDLYATVTVSPYYANQVFDALDGFRSGKKLPDYIRVEDFVIDGSNVAQHESFAF